MSKDTELQVSLVGEGGGSWEYRDDLTGLEEPVSKEDLERAVGAGADQGPSTRLLRSAGLAWRHGFWSPSVQHPEGCSVQSRKYREKGRSLWPLGAP